MKKPLLLSIFTILFISAFAQRKIDQPILLVHGLGSNNETWDDFTRYLANQGLSICPNPISFNLDSDNNRHLAILENDVRMLQGASGDYDVYGINFEVKGTLSNQAAITKQGYALFRAINDIISVAKCQRVMVLGHSMGGLAAREYIQNPKYFNSGADNISKLATIGTPHGGSNFGLGGLDFGIFGGNDVESDAVRDLRKSYKNGKNGVYLFGGYETTDYLQIDIANIFDYYSLDVNCNGITGEPIKGLNQYDLPTNITEFSCVVAGPDAGDGVVTVESQNLKTIYPTGNIDLFSYNCINTTSAFCHTSEPKTAFFEMMQALDVPKRVLSNITADKEMIGFFTKQANGSVVDTDEFIVFAPRKSNLNIIPKFENGAKATISVKNTNGTITTNVSFNLNNNNINTIPIPSAEAYTISISGNVINGVSKYSLFVSFTEIIETPPCAAPDTTIKLEASRLSFCEGKPANISIVAPEGYDQYKFYKNGIEIQSGKSNRYLAMDSGVFTAKISRCNVEVNTSNVIEIRMIPKFNISVKVDTLATKYRLTSSFGRSSWYRNDKILTGDDYFQQKIIEVFQPGVYFASSTANENGCQNSSPKVRIEVEKPKLLANRVSFCEGDSTIIEASNNFSNYRFFVNTDTINTTSKRIVIKNTSKVAVIALRGYMESPISETVTITANPTPNNPIIEFTNEGIKSSYTTGNQWFLNGTMLGNENQQNLKNTIGGASYVVRFTDSNGCFSDSKAFVITGNETELTNNFNLYPNPTTDFLTVDLSENDFNTQIIDSKGKIIQETNNEKTLKLGNLGKGLYLIRVETKNSFFVGKVVVE